MSLDDVSHIGLLERAAQYRLCLILNVDGRTVRPTISDAFDSFDCWYTSDGMRQQISPPPPHVFFFFFGEGGLFPSFRRDVWSHRIGESSPVCLVCVHIIGRPFDSLSHKMTSSSSTLSCPFRLLFWPNTFA